MSGLLFLLALDWIIRRTLQEGSTGIRWKFVTKLEDLYLADDIARLLSSTKQHILPIKTDMLVDEAGKVGLKLNVEKCKLQTANKL